MNKPILKMIVPCLASVVLGIGCLVYAVGRSDPVFVLAGFAALLPFPDRVRALRERVKTNQLQIGKKTKWD